jgi:putative ABC transport system permease protein
MTLRGIGRSKRRSAATVVAVVLSLVLILAAGGMIDSMVRLIDRQFNELALEDASVITDTGVTDALISDIASTPGVDVAEPVATFDASVTANGDALATTLKGFEAGTVMHGWATPEGSLPSDGILAGREITARLGLEVGDPITIALPAQDVSITMDLVGLVDEPLGVPLYARTDAIEAAIARSGIVDPRTVTDLPTVTTAMVRLAPDASRDATLGAIDEVEGVVSVLDARTLYEAVQQYLGLFYAFVGIMALFGGVMAFALMFNIISVNTAERSPEFAALEASGMSGGMIARMIAGENLLLTAMGVLPGVAIGIAAAGAFLHLFDNDSFNLSLTIRPLTVVIAVLAMFAVAALSIVPGVRAVRRLDIGAVVRERAM